MNTSLSRLRPQVVGQAIRLLSSNASSSNPPPKKSTELATLGVKKLDSKKFLEGISQESTSLIENVRIEVDESKDVTLFNGVPREHIDNRRVKIFKQAKNAMQSATADTKLWKIEFETRDRWENPLMGWGSSGDPLSNFIVQFSSKEDAIDFCEKNGWLFTVEEPQVRKPRKASASYASNFSWSSRTRVGSK